VEVSAMFDIVLAWIVVIAPTLFALGLEVMNDNVRKHRFWKYGVILFGISLSALTFWQQYRAVKNAKADEENAIQHTAENVTKELAPKVAADTSSSVTSALNKEYGVVIGNLYRQIGEMQTRQQSQIGLTQKQLELNYALSVDLIYAGDQLQIWNRGKTNIYMWGNRYNGALDLVTSPMQITPAGNYYLLTNVLQSVIYKQLGQNGEARVPFDLYLTSEDNKKFVVHNTLWEIVKDGAITIHTQTHGNESLTAWPVN
jgi:hypothetical protein